MKLHAPKKDHLLMCQDSNVVCFPPEYDLIVTSPPFFHPRYKNSRHGFSPDINDIVDYAEYVAKILLNAYLGLKPNKVLCVIKTDLWYKGILTPVGFHIVQSCLARGLNLHAHWIWVKKDFYSPYGPSFSNIFILGRSPFQRVKSNGIIQTKKQVKKSNLSSPEAELFAILIQSLSEEGSVILDPFVGKGAMIEAAAETKRIGVGIEISPDQFEFARHRLERINVQIVNSNNSQINFSEEE